MPYNFEDRLDYGRTRMRDVNFRYVTYSHNDSGSSSSGQTTVENVKCSCSEWRPDDYVNYGVTMDVRMRDYIIDVSSLPFVPAENDEITDGNLTCKVVPQSSGGGNERDSSNEPHFRYTNHLRKAYRIHTVVIAED